MKDSNEFDDVIKNNVDFLSERGQYITHHKTGSVYICDPPVLRNDLDVIILVKEKNETRDLLLNVGFYHEGASDVSNSAFYSLRLGKVNFIITEDLVWYTKFLAATELCKHLNVLDKEKRIDIFTTVIEDKHKSYGAEEDWAVGTVGPASIYGASIATAKTATTSSRT